MEDLLSVLQEAEQYNIAIDRINEIIVPEPTPQGNTMPFILVDNFDHNTNLWIAENRRNNKSIDVYSPHITSIIPTTQTIGGNIANVHFMEAELIARAEADTTIVAILCNFGRKIYPGYVLPIKPVGASQQRQEKKKARRKQQGNATQMNSQISFLVRADSFEENSLDKYPTVDNITQFPSDIKIYKIKIFRNGYTQIPGAHPKNIEGIVSALSYVVEYLNKYLVPQYPIRVININPIMYNYKFKINIPTGHIFDIKRLGIYSIEDHNGDDLLVGNTSSVTKISLQFIKAVGDKEYTSTFAIFRSGKTNIQSGVNIDYTTASCKYILSIIERHYDDIFPKVLAPAILLPQNIRSNNLMPL